MQPKGFIMSKAKKAWNMLSLSALMAFLSACGKDPVPQPTPEPTPTDTISPTDTVPQIIPTKEITIYWDWDANIGWAPTKDSIKYYTDQDSVKTVDINIIGRKGLGFPVNTSGCSAGAFHRARDTLQTRIDIAPSKIKLSGTILIHKTLPNHDAGQEPGMAIYDSTWFTTQGCLVRRPPRTK